MSEKINDAARHLSQKVQQQIELEEKLHGQEDMEYLEYLLGIKLHIVRKAREYASKS